MKKNILIFSFLLCFIWSNGQSIFSQGDWYKVAVGESGVFKLDKAYLQSLGLDVSNPEKIALYGGDGRMLEQRNSDTRAIQPQEVPMLYLDTGAYKTNFSFFFYNEGSRPVNVDENGELSTQTNIYTDTLFYYLTVQSQDGMRVEQETTEVSDSFTSIVTQYKHFELDEENMFHSGRVWYSHKMDNSTPFHVFDFGNKTVLSNPLFRYNVIGSSVQESIYANFYINDSLALSQRIIKSFSGYGVKARIVDGDFSVSSTIIPLNEDVLLKVELDNKTDVSAFGFIDYVSCQYQTLGSEIETEHPFYSMGSPKEIKKVTNQEYLWAINQKDRSQYLAYSKTIGDSTCFQVSGDTLELFFVDINTVTQVPFFDEKLDNIDLLSLSMDPELIIVYPRILKEEALLFEEYKNSIGTPSLAVELDQVCDLFASGKKDVSAIRNYVKYVYDNTSNLQHLLLFGDCSYDYKDRVEDNTNLIPIYESQVSLQNVQTHSSDDYYGFMDDNEGEWLENSNGNHKLDISVGRFPVKNSEEALQVIEKIKFYTSNLNPERWGNKVIFVADDKDDALHIDQANQLADLVIEEEPFFTYDKVYLDAYQHTKTDVSEVTDDLVKKINAGAMFVNFTGHGDEYGWTEERLFTRANIVNLDNKQNLPIFLIATCEFGRFDDPSLVSGGEELILDDAGAIALVTTTRPVYSSSNFTINKAFYRELFKRDDLGRFKTLGEVFRNTKNESLDNVYNRNFSLLGDPSMRINIPNMTVELDSIDGIESSEYSDSLKPGQHVRLQGVVKGIGGSVATDFNGTVEIVIYESSETKETFGYEGQETIEYKETPVELYSAQVSVVDGAFKAEIIIPIEFSNNYDLAHVIFHAVSDTQEAYGDKQGLIIGGETIFNENNPPVIKIIYPEEQLEGQYSNSVTFNFLLTDDHGISMSPSILGKETILTINNDEVIILNSQMKMVDGSAKAVEFTVEINELFFGENIFEMKTFDIYGVKTVKQFSLNVGYLVDVIVFPTLLEDKWNIHTIKTVVEEDFELEIKVYNDLGQLLFSKREEVEKNTFGEEFMYSAEEMNINYSGIYFYDINMRYKYNNQSRHIKGKLIKM